MKKLELILLTLILIFGAYLRFTSLSQPPLWIDEAISVDIAQNAQSFNLETSGGVKRGGYFLHYTMAFFMLFGNSEFWARFPSVIFGLLTILLAFFIGKEYSKSGGIICALFTSVFYLQVFFSRQSRYYQLFQLCFFSSLYLLYKSKNKPWLIYPAILILFIAIDTHLQGILLCFFFIIHIFLYNKKWLVIFPSLPFLFRFFKAVTLSTKSVDTSINYASLYFKYSRQITYLLILFIPGLILSYKKKKRLTLLLIIPSLITLFGVFSLQVFAFRYVYFFTFPLILFSSLFISYMYDKLGKGVLIPILILLIFPSNIILPYTYSTMLKPTTAQFYDASAPYTNYKLIPDELKQNMIDGTLVSYFSPDVMYYIKSPDYVIPFSMDGRSPDQVSINNGTIDRYSGAKILTEVLDRPYYLTADFFSVKKLNKEQAEFHELMILECNIEYENDDLKIYYCLDN